MRYLRVLFRSSRLQSRNFSTLAQDSSRLGLLVALLATFLCAPALWAQTQTATLSFSMTPATPTFADTETVTVTLKGPSGQPLPTGTVSYTIDGGTAQTAAVNPTNPAGSTAVAYFPVTPLPPGSHAVAITYNGDGTYLPSATPTNDAFTVADLPLSFLYGSYPGSAYLDIYYNGGYPEFFGVSGIAVDAHENEYLAYGLTIQGNGTTPTPQIIKIPTPNLRAQTVPVTGIGQDVQLAVDAAGNLYLADPHNGRVIEYPVTGSQSNLAITGLKTPAGITYDAANNLLYILDTGSGGVISYNLATKATNTIFSGVTGLAATVAVDGKGSIYYIENLQVMVRAPNGTTTPIYGEFLSYFEGFPANSPNSLAYNEVTGDLWISSISSGGESYFRLDKFHHASSAGYSGGQSQQIALDSFGEMYASGGSVISPGPAAADSGPGDAESYQGFPDEAPYGTFSVPYSETSQTGVYGSARAENSGITSNQDIGFGAVQYPISYTTGSGTTLNVPSYGIGFGSNLALSQGVASTLPGTFSNIGGLTYYAPRAGAIITLYISDKVNNTVTSVAFESSTGGVSLSGSNPVNTLGFTGLKQPTQLAVDGAANVYVLDQGAAAGSRIVRLDYTGHQTLPYTADTGDPAGYVKSVTAFTLDGPTNLYLGGSDASGNGVIARLDPLGNEFKLASGIGVPAAMAIDATYNLFAIDTSGTLVKIDRAGDVTTLATGLPISTSLSIDASDTVFLAGGTAKTVLAIAPDGTQTPVTLPGITNPVATTIDGLGNYYFGDGTANQIALNFRSQANLNFGTVSVDAAATIPDTLTNVGNLPMASLTPSGGNAGPTNYVPYTIASAASNGCEFLASSNYQPTGSPTDLAPGQLCNVVLTYAPTTAEQDVSSISVGGYNETGGGFVGETGSGFAQWNLTGKAVVGAPAPNPVLAPQNLAFGNVTVGSHSNAQTATLSNTGNAALSITSINFFGSDPGSFSQTNNCGASLAAGASCSIAVTCVPPTAGAFTANLGTNFPSPIPQQSITLTCDGTSVVTAPAATLTPATLAFGSVTTGSSSAAQTATLTNTGNAALTITGITLSGANASVFADTNNCGSSLAAGANCTISVVFTPTSAGAATATLSIADNASGSPQTSSLTGTGVATSIPPNFSLTAAPSSRSVTAGSAANYTLTLTSVGTPLTSPVTLSASGLPAGASVSFSPASVTPSSAGAASIMTIQTAATQTAHLDGKRPLPGWRLATPVLAAVFFLVPFSRVRKWRGLLCLALAVIALTSLTGCGAGFGLPQPSGTPITSTITVTGTSGSLTQSTTVQITITPASTVNAAE
jgi:sugar lactone lactonase YvrE